MANFEKFYMRPNLNNYGTVPANGTLSSSPDIWISGLDPIPNFQKVLSTDEKYSAQSDQNVAIGQTNYIYVRGKNGGREVCDNNVSLFYAQSNAIQWPGQWVNNQIGTAEGQKGKAKFSKVAPVSISVCDRPFIWQNVPSPDNGTHFCLISQINDDKNSNPFPSVCSAIDMASLVSKNLQWGWRNIQTFKPDGSVEISFTTGLTVPLDISDDECEFSCEVTPKNLKGFQIAFSCSEADSRGNLIKLNKTQITENDGEEYGCRCFLKPGFKALVTVTLYNDSHLTIPVGATFPFEPLLVTTRSELQKANLLHLFDSEMEYRTKKLINRNIYTAENWGMRALVKMGNYEGAFKK